MVTAVILIGVGIGVSVLGIMKIVEIFKKQYGKLTKSFLFFFAYYAYHIMKGDVDKCLLYICLYD